MECRAKDFYTFIRPNQEQLRKMQLWALWQESNLRSENLSLKIPSAKSTTTISSIKQDAQNRVSYLAHT
jgi:hypothetical protein